MLARRVKIRLHQHRTALFVHRIRDGVIISQSPVLGRNSRQFSLSTITEPISRAVETLPLPLQYNIPESVLSLSEAWIPAGLPTYTTGIFVFAVLTRLCIFTPWSYWARRRKWRVQELVRPQAIGEMVFGWGPPLQERLTKQGLTKAERSVIIEENLGTRGEELEKLYKCTKWPTFIIPTVFTLPAFIVASSIMYSAGGLPAIAANPNMAEFFLLPDVAPYIPIGIGVLSMLSVEIGTLSPRTMKAMGKIDAKDAEVAAKKLETGNRTPTDKVLDFKPNQFAQSLFRLLGLGRAAICVGLPGTVNIFWFTSTLLGSIEALIFTAIERSRAPLHWGRNSRLLLQPRSKLEELGWDLSRITPLERLGKANYTQKPSVTRTPSKLDRTASNVLLNTINTAEGAVNVAKQAKSRTMASIAVAQEKVHDVVSSSGQVVNKTVEYVAPKVNRFSSLGIKDLKEWKDEASSRFVEWKDVKVEKMDVWLQQSGEMERRIKRGSKPRKELSAEDRLKIEKKKRQWLFVLSQMNKEKAKEARMQAKNQAAMEKAERNVPGLQPKSTYPRPPSQETNTSKPLIN